MYTHDSKERAERQAFFKRDKEIAQRLSPNITRSFKTLDVGVNSKHTFYMSMVEIGVSMEHPLHTNSALRAHGVASPHYRFVAPPSFEHSGKFETSGASPKSIATGDFAVLPLWSVDVEMGTALDAAHAESATNTMPMRGETIKLDAHASETLEKSIETLRELQMFLDTPGKETAAPTHMSEHIVSFSALTYNVNAIRAFVDVVKAEPNTTGVVYGLDTPIAGIATCKRHTTLAKGTEPTGAHTTLAEGVEPTDAHGGVQEVEAGRVVVISLHVPVAV